MATIEVDLEELMRQRKEVEQLKGLMETFVKSVPEMQKTIREIRPIVDAAAKLVASRLSEGKWPEEESLLVKSVRDYWIKHGLDNETGSPA